MGNFFDNHSRAAIAMVALGLAASARAESNCSVATLKGTFGFNANGFLTAPSPGPGPFAAIGVQSFDGKGNTAATSTVSVNGDVHRVTINGTYTVNSDCTGSMTLTFSPSGLVNHLDFLVFSNGAKLQGIRTDPGVVGTGNYRKLPEDDPAK
jgi:hypothetical protein